MTNQKMAVPSDEWWSVPPGRGPVTDAEILCARCGATVTPDEPCPHITMRIEDGGLKVFQSSGETRFIQPLADD